MKAFLLRHIFKIWLASDLILIVALMSYRATVWTVMAGVGCLTVVTGLLLLLTRRLVLSVHVGAVLALAMQILSEAKRFFWKDRLLFPDFSIILDPSNAGTILHYPVASFCLAFITVVLVGSVCICARRLKTDRPLRFARAVGITAALIGAFGVTLSFRGQEAWLATLPKGSNVIANLVFSSDIRYRDPADTLVDPNAAPFPTEHTTVTPPKELPDVLILLAESTFDPALLDGVKPNTLPKTELFDSPLTDTSGLLRVHTYGGATWRSEFSLLTGLSSNDFEPRQQSVFYSAVFHVKDSLFRVFKRHGYRVVVLSPFMSGSYNSGKTYRHLGADVQIHPADLHPDRYKRHNLWTISTDEMLTLAKEVFAQAKEPTLVYALTMKEHGPYKEDDRPEMALEAEAESRVSKSEILRLEGYAARVVEADQAYKKFDRWVKDRKKPMLFVRFGDHQPDLGWKGGYRIDDPKPDYVTGFSVTDNRPGIKRSRMNTMDLVYLPGLILESVPLPAGEFFSATQIMRRAGNGCYTDCTDEALLASYRREIFGRLGAASADAQ